MFGATVAAGLMTDTDLDVGPQQVSCDTAASAGLRSSFSGNRADGRPSLCSSEFAGGFRVAGGAGGAETALATAVESKRINRLLEVTEPDAGCAANAASAAVAWAAAGESERIIGSCLQSESDFPSLNSSSLGSLSSACARPVFPFCCFCVCTCLPWFFISCCVCCCCTFACFDPA